MSAFATEPSAQPVPTGLFAHLDRGRLASCTRAVLSRGGRAKADVLLVESEIGPVVVKDFSGRGPVVHAGFGPWSLRREARIYARLAGLPEVPRLLGWLDARAFVLEYRPGILLSRSLAGRVPADFISRLERAIAAMHARGVVHLDLRHRSNVLAGEDGRPVVLDFASALAFDPGTTSGRLGIRLAGAIDRRALEKWRVRIPG